MQPTFEQRVQAAHQLGLDLGERCAIKAEEASPEFRARAYAFIVNYAAEHRRFTGEDCTHAMKAAGIVAHDDRATGPVYARAIREGVVHIAGMARRARGHGSAGGKVYGQGRAPA